MDFVSFWIEIVWFTFKAITLIMPLLCWSISRRPKIYKKNKKGRYKRLFNYENVNFD